MKNTKLKNQYFASCPLGLESLLEDEIKRLKIDKTQIASAGVHFESFPEGAVAVILNSRIASRVFKKLFQFEIKNEKDLYHEIKDIKWKAVFNLDQTFKIQVLQGKSSDGQKRSQYANPLYLAQLSKDAIVDRFRKDCEKRPSVEKENPDVSLLIHIEPNINPFSKKEMVTISLDMCGKPLSFRGYRQASVEAPLRENLAAAMALKAQVSAQDSIYNPMCGSATLAIEALLIQADIAPSYLRVKSQLAGGVSEWSFLNHNFYVKDKYLKANVEKMLNEIDQKTINGMEKLKKLKHKVICCDTDNFALKAARINLDIAGLSEFAQLINADATELELPGFEGKILVNPPYGERLQEGDVEKTYRDLGERLKKSFKGSQAFILSANLAMVKKIQLQTSERMIVHNAKLESRILYYELF